jgi:hypothetical protein
MANSLCLLTLGKEISELTTEEKVLNIYSPDAKAEVPTKVQVLMDLLNQEILVGLIKQTVDKTAKDAAGAYQPTGETREENEIDKFFRARDLRRLDQKVDWQGQGQNHQNFGHHRCSRCIQLGGCWYQEACIEPVRLIPGR